MAFSPRGVDALMRGLLTRRIITRAIGLTPTQLDVCPAEWHHYYQEEFVGRTPYVVFFYSAREIWEAFSLHVLACTPQTSCPCPVPGRRNLPRAARGIVEAIRAARAFGVEAAFEQVRDVPHHRLVACPTCSIDVVDTVLDDHRRRVHSPEARAEPDAPVAWRRAQYLRFMQLRRGGAAGASGSFGTRSSSFYGLDERSA